MEAIKVVARKMRYRLALHKEKRELYWWQYGNGFGKSSQANIYVPQASTTQKCNSAKNAISFVFKSNHHWYARKFKQKEEILAVHHVISQGHLLVWRSLIYLFCLCLVIIILNDTIALILSALIPPSSENTLTVQKV